jgi:tetratricopeptide (TPR) repeat protein
MNLTEKITEVKPNLKPNTIKQYEAQLNKLKKSFDTDDWDFITDIDAVEDSLKHLSYLSQRNMYNAIIVLLLALNSDGDYDETLKDYQQIRDVLNDQYSTEQSEGKVLDSQKDKLVNISVIEEMIETMKKEILVRKLKTKTKLTQNDITLVRAYTLYSMLVRIPTRNDFSNLLYISQTQYKKLKDTEKEQNNYLVDQRGNMKIILNQYKTAKKYGENVISIDADLKKIINSYIKIMDFKITDNIFPLSRNALTQLLTKTSEKYIGKKISTTAIRKSYLSSKYGDLKKEMEADAVLMGNSVGVQQSTYVKDIPEDN